MCFVYKLACEGEITALVNIEVMEKYLELLGVGGLCAASLACVTEKVFPQTIGSVEFVSFAMNNCHRVGRCASSKRLRRRGPLMT